jgi:hypothetical protein
VKAGTFGGNRSWRTAIRRNDQLEVLLRDQRQLLGREKLRRGSLLQLCVRLFRCPGCAGMLMPLGQSVDSADTADCRPFPGQPPKPLIASRRVTLPFSSDIVVTPQLKEIV